MSENEKHHNNNNTEMENNAVPIIRPGRMKYGWYHTINNTVCYCQMPFNIALILEQASNHNNLLREQINMENSSCIRQKNMVCDEKVLYQNCVQRQMNV